MPRQGLVITVFLVRRFPLASLVRTVIWHMERLPCVVALAESSCPPVWATTRLAAAEQSTLFWDAATPAGSARRAAKANRYKVLRKRFAIFSLALAARSLPELRSGFISGSRVGSKRPGDPFETPTL
jgi:hypothetical protein